MDFTAAGEAASSIRKTCMKLGLPARDVRRVAIVAYEAELNVVIHAWKGTVRALVFGDRVELVVEDSGPGIPDIAQAMVEGFSTAPDHVREMGFGAGMGLINIQRHADDLVIESVVNVGTVLRATVRLGAG
ncbi:MAG TPA: anti-sigma regulatory factor [Clostridiales bacterium UBA8153]|nr:anti-sigma regulatory factor [Clostridiales bacterium UBA8153]